MSERDEFEAVFPMPPDTIRCGEGYAVTSYNAWKGMEFCAKWKGWKAARAPQAVPALTAKQRYDEFMEPGEEPSPIERLRFFCSLAMSGQDWLDVEPFFDDLLAASQPSPEQKEPEHAHDWRFSLQDHLYKCDCGATRGDYPFGAASFKD